MNPDIVLVDNTNMPVITHAHWMKDDNTSGIYHEKDETLSPSLMIPARDDSPESEEKQKFNGLDE